MLDTAGGVSEAPIGAPSAQEARLNNLLGNNT
jgi:hypothetical protein